MEPGGPRAFQCRGKPARMQRRRLPFSPPTLRACRSSPKRSIFHWDRPCASIPGRLIKSVCCRCSFRCSGHRSIVPWLKTMVETGEIFHPLRWTPGEAMQLLKDVPQLESGGRRGPHARRLARKPSTAAASGGYGRRQRAQGNRPGCASRFPHGSDARWRIPERPRDPGVVSENRRARASQGPVGGDRSRAPHPHDGAFPRSGAYCRREQGSPSERPCGCSREPR